MENKIKTDDLTNIFKEEYVEYLHYYEPIERKLLNYGYVVNANMMLYYKDRIIKHFEEEHNIPLKYVKIGDLDYLVLSSNEINKEIEKFKKLQKLINIGTVVATILSLLILCVGTKSRVMLALLCIPISFLFIFLFLCNDTKIKHTICNLCDDTIIKLDKYDKEYVDNIIRNAIHSNELSDNEIIKIKKFYDFEEVKEKLKNYK